MTELPDHLVYSMRFPGELRRTEGAMNPLWYNWRTDFLFPMFQPGGARNWASQHDGVPSGYYVEGFLFIQNFIFTAFASLKNSVGIDLTDVPNIVMNVSLLAICCLWSADSQIFFLFLEISVPTVCIRHSSARPSDARLTLHHAQLRLPLHKHNKIHHHREGETIKRSDENYGLR